LVCLSFLRCNTINSVNPHSHHTLYIVCRVYSYQVWSTQALGRDAVVQSSLTYSAQGGRIRSTEICDNTHTVASASDEGSVHLFRLDHGNRTVGVSGPSSDGSDPVVALASFTTMIQHVLIYATQSGYIHAWDLRARREAFVLRMDASLGLITTVALGPENTWLVVGTHGGYIALWDLRFKILIKVRLLMERRERRERRAVWFMQPPLLGEMPRTSFRVDYRVDSYFSPVFRSREAVRKTLTLARFTICNILTHFKSSFFSPARSGDTQIVAQSRRSWYPGPGTSHPKVRLPCITIKPSTPVVESTSLVARLDEVCPGGSPYHFLSGNPLPM